MQLINPPAGIFSPALVVRDANGNVTGTTTETTFPNGTYTVPGGYLRAGRCLRIDFLIDSIVQGAVASTLRVKFGGVTLHTIGSTSVSDKIYDGRLLSINDTSQIYRGTLTFINGASGSGAVGAGGIDTTIDQLLEITLQPGAATDSWDLRHLVLRIEEQRT